MSMMQAIKAQPQPDDLFSMTAADTAAMRAIARRQLFGRIKAQAQTPRAEVESALAESMTQAAKLEDAPSLNETRQIEAATKVLDLLDEPRTAKQIAAALRKSDTGVMNTLRRMHMQGRVQVTHVGKNGERYWLKTSTQFLEREKPQALTTTGQATRDAVLAAVSDGATATDIAKATGRERSTVLKALYRHIEDGLVVRAGTGKNNSAIYERVRA